LFFKRSASLLKFKNAACVFLKVAAGLTLQAWIEQRCNAKR